MRAKQISLNERIQFMKAGLLADKSGLTAILEKSASLPLEQFFFRKCDFREFMDIFRESLGGVMETPETYQDAAEAAYRLFILEKQKQKTPRSGLMEILKDNYKYFYEAEYGIDDEILRAERESEEIPERPRQLCLEERIRRADDKKTGQFPAVLLPVQQLYLGTCMLTKSYYPVSLYEDRVKPLVQETQREEKKVKLKNTVADMAMMGWRGSGDANADDLFHYMAIIPYILIKEAKEDFVQYGE